ncbi:MAG: hypothetical protein FD129_1645, partial [bacterium]
DQESIDPQPGRDGGEQGQATKKGGRCFVKAVAPRRGHETDSAGQEGDKGCQRHRDPQGDQRGGVGQRFVQSLSPCRRTPTASASMAGATTGRDARGADATAIVPARRSDSMLAIVSSSSWSSDTSGR